jgi:hypothetical protein
MGIARWASIVVMFTMLPPVPCAIRCAASWHDSSAHNEVLVDDGIRAVRRHVDDLAEAAAGDVHEHVEAVETLVDREERGERAGVAVPKASKYESTPRSSRVAVMFCTASASRSHTATDSARLRQGDGAGAPESARAAGDHRHLAGQIGSLVQHARLHVLDRIAAVDGYARILPRWAPMALTERQDRSPR